MLLRHGFFSAVAGLPPAAFPPGPACAAYRCRLARVARYAAHPVIEQGALRMSAAQPFRTERFRLPAARRCAAVAITPYVTLTLFASGTTSCPPPSATFGHPVNRHSRPTPTSLSPPSTAAHGPAAVYVEAPPAIFQMLPL